MLITEIIQFIDLLTNQKGKRANNRLKPSMTEVKSTCVVGYTKYPGRRIILVDTPGFDASMSDMEVLEIISKWLNSR
jgi:hypothetical protein